MERDSRKINYGYAFLRTWIDPPHRIHETISDIVISVGSYEAFRGLDAIFHLHISHLLDFMLPHFLLLLTTNNKQPDQSHILFPLDKSIRYTTSEPHLYTLSESRNVSRGATQRVFY